jgi:CDP-glycerol glycerophosphotransferase (TagB/SpsB family)
MTKFKFYDKPEDFFNELDRDKAKREKEEEMVLEAMNILDEYLKSNGYDWWDFGARDVGITANTVFLKLNLEKKGNEQTICFCVTFRDDGKKQIGTIDADDFNKLMG